MEPDVHMYHGLIIACRKSPRMDAWVHALRFINAIAARGVPLSATSYNEVLHVLANCYRDQASPRRC
jgi:hypothetical protein